MMPAVAVIQMVSGQVLQANLDAAARLLQEARNQGAVLAVLPENFAIFGGQPSVEWLAAQPAGTHAINDWLSHTAKALGLWIVGGTVPWLPDGQRQAAVHKAYTASQLFNADGDCVARYCKMHLFDVDVADAHGSYRESDNFLRGEQPVVVDTPVGRLGLAVCYDLRFPELFRALRAQGAELFSLPSAFTRVTTEAHWWPLIRARAIENQCYVLAANQGGWHNETRETGGQSAIISPWGDVLAQTGMGEAICLAGIDRQHLQETRRQMPVHQHRHASLGPGEAVTQQTE